MLNESKPIWIESKKKEYNKLCGFLLKFHNAEQNEYTLNVAAADCYQCYLNGEFLVAGPARSAKGFFRVDSLPIGDRLREGENILVFFVASYRVNSFEYADNEGFLQAEVTCGDRVLTGTNAYTLAFDVPWYTQKTLRYSFQRAFTEVWKLDENFAETLSGERIVYARKAAVQPDKNLLPRASRIPNFSDVTPCVIGSGSMRCGQEYDRSVEVLNGPAFLEPTPVFEAFPKRKLECNLYEELRGMKTVSFDFDVDEGDLQAGLFRLYDFKTDGCGFLSLEFTAETDSVFYVLFDEILTDLDVDPFRLNCIDCVKYECKKGAYRTLGLEPYTFRYAKIFCAQGCVRVARFAVKEVANPDVPRASYVGGEAWVTAVYNAALNSFRFNCVDILTDCPSRERAGWLCDGYFTGHVEHVLTGRNAVEHDFLENFLLNKRFEHLPKGMLPMCYPASHPDKNFIPTWAMWFVLELERYERESGDRDLTRRAQNKVSALLEYFEKYENEEGLLEDLDGWVFIEWSKAAEFTNGVNWCVNMLYAYMLEKVGKLYANESAAFKAAKLKELIRQRSFNGKFFTDHAVRQNGEITPCNDTSEVCQYYAFFTETATPERYPELWDTLVHAFGPRRKQDNKYPEVWFANAFIGNYLRLILLERYNLRERLVSEIKDYFAYMAEKTGTLWENDTDAASCNHGFASYALCWLKAPCEK